MSIPTLLLTGFEPFGGDTVNNSWEIAQAVQKQWQEIATELPMQLIVLKLPVSWTKTIPTFMAAIQQYKPHYVVCLGLSKAVALLHFEEIARNTTRAIPDNEQQFFALKQAINTPINPNWPTTHASTLPKTWLLNNYAPYFTVGQDAGAYLCNFLFFHLMQLTPTIKCKGFIHVGASKEAKLAGIEVLMGFVQSFVAKEIPTV